VRVLRADNISSESVVVPPGTCGGPPVPYTLTSSCVTAGTPSELRKCNTDFRYDPGTQLNSLAFVFHWEWPLYTTIPSTGIPDLIPYTLQTFDSGVDNVPLKFCAGTTWQPDLTLPQKSKLLGVADQDGNPGGINNGIHAGCLINRAVQQQGGGAILIEDAWVQGDYAARR